MTKIKPERKCRRICFPETGTAGSDFTLDVHPFGYINKAVKTSATSEKALLKKDAMTALYLFCEAASSAN